MLPDIAITVAALLLFNVFAAALWWFCSPSAFKQRAAKKRRLDIYPQW
jgi:hypothetical protein